MKFNVIYALGDKCHITGNEIINHTVMTDEEYKIFRDRRDVLITNVWKYTEGEDISDHFA